MLAFALAAGLAALIAAHATIRFAMAAGFAILSDHVAKRRGLVVVRLALIALVSTAAALGLAFTAGLCWGRI